MIVKEYFEFYSNYRAQNSLGNYLKENNVIGLSDIDTRELTKHIRVKGAMNGIISTINFDYDYLSKLKEYPGLTGRDLARNVTCQKPYLYNKNIKNYRYFIVAVDYGIKLNILRCLADAGFKKKVVPAFTMLKNFTRKSRWHSFIKWPW